MVTIYSLHLRLGLPDGLPVERSNHLVYLLPAWTLSGNSGAAGESRRQLCEALERKKPPRKTSLENKHLRNFDDYPFLFKLYNVGEVLFNYTVMRAVEVNTEKKCCVLTELLS